MLYRSDLITLEAHPRPHHCRRNGGHLVIRTAAPVEHRHQLDPHVAAAMLDLSIAAEAAMFAAAGDLGLNVARINHADFGNWAYHPPARPAHVHWHLYVRCWDEQHPAGDPRFQAFPNALVFPPPGDPFYVPLEPFTDAEQQIIAAHLDARIGAAHPALAAAELPAA